MWTKSEKTKNMFANIAYVFVHMYAHIWMRVYARIFLPSLQMYFRLKYSDVYVCKDVYVCMYACILYKYTHWDIDIICLYLSMCVYACIVYACIYGCVCTYACSLYVYRDLLWGLLSSSEKRSIMNSIDLVHRIANLDELLLLLSCDSQLLSISWIYCRRPDNAAASAPVLRNNWTGHLKPPIVDQFDSATLASRINRFLKSMMSDGTIHTLHRTRGSVDSCCCILISWYTASSSVQSNFRSFNSWVV